MNGKSVSPALQGFFKLAELVNELRTLCRAADDGGTAQPMWPADNPTGPAVTAVPVKDIEAALDRFTYTVVILDEVITFDETSFVAGETGQGKDTNNNFRTLLDKIARLGRTGG